MRSSLSIQVGGDHYKGVAVQPVEFSELNSLTFCEGNVVKYLLRYKKKSGIEDLEKVGHYLQLLEDLSGKKSKWGDCAMPRYGNLQIPVEELWKSWPDTHPTAKAIIITVCEWRHVEMGERRRFQDLAHARHLLESLINEEKSKGVPVNACIWTPPDPYADTKDFPTSCGTFFRLPDDNPQAGEDFKRCPKCGKPISLTGKSL